MTYNERRNGSHVRTLLRSVRQNPYLSLSIEIISRENLSHFFRPVDLFLIHSIFNLMRGRKLLWIQKLFGNEWVRLAAFSSILLYHLPELGLMRQILLLLTGSLSIVLGIFITIHIGKQFIKISLTFRCKFTNPKSSQS